MNPSEIISILRPFVSDHKQQLVEEISKFDSFELVMKLEEELKQIEHHLANLTEYAINYYQKLLDKYGKDRERKTEIANFETIKAAVVAANNSKLYINREDGFV